MRPSESLPTLDVASAWALIGEPVEHVEPIGGGTRSRVYRVTLVDGDTRIVRLTPRGTNRLAREAWVRTRMKGQPDVPVVSAVAATHTSLSQWADVALMRDAPGRSLDVVLAKASADAAEALWRAFGAGLSALHVVPVEGFGLLDGSGRGASPAWRPVATTLAAQSLAEARATSLADLCDEAEATLARLAPALDRVHASTLVHGDAQPANVLARGATITAWLDFEFAMGADPLYELAFVGRFFEAAPWSPADAVARTRQMEAFTRGYSARLATVADDPERLGYYRLTHALRAAEMLRDPSLDGTRRDEATTVLRERVRSTLEAINRS